MDLSQGFHLPDINRKNCFFIFLDSFFDLFIMGFYRRKKQYARKKQKRNNGGQCIMITKKHFNKIAELIERNIPQGKFIIADDLVKDLADFFESDNPNFHRGKFIHACHNPKNKKVA
tara:strand:+ start:188 stop:538 length:351 start_codon:yes stop_codon:yes gene_type:complete